MVFSLKCSLCHEWDFLDLCNFDLYQITMEENGAHTFQSRICLSIHSRFFLKWDKLHFTFNHKCFSLSHGNGFGFPIYSLLLLRSREILLRTWDRANSLTTWGKRRSTIPCVFSKACLQKYCCPPFTCSLSQADAAWGHTDGGRDGERKKAAAVMTCSELPEHCNCLSSCLPKVWVFRDKAPWLALLCPLSILHRSRRWGWQGTRGQKWVVVALLLQHSTTWSDQLKDRLAIL